MTIIAAPVRLTLVEGTSTTLPDTVVEFSEPFNKRILFELKGDPGFVPGAQVSFGLNLERYLDQTHMVLATTFDPGTRLPGTYRGTAAFSACPPFIFASTVVGCSGSFPNASGSVPYEIVINEITTTFTPLSNTAANFDAVGRFSTDVPINVPYQVSAQASAPFGGAYLSNDGSGYVRQVAVPTATPRGTVLTGNVSVRICRDSPSICAFPRRGSPFNVTVSYTAR